MDLEAKFDAGQATPAQPAPTELAPLSIAVSRPTRPTRQDLEIGADDDWLTEHLWMG
jgi:hypothetical protein